MWLLIMDKSAFIVEARTHGECSEQDHEINLRGQSFVRIQNPRDQWCLARSILVGLKYYKEGQQRTPSFKAYCVQQHLTTYANAAKQLLVDSGISTQKAEYDLNDAKKIQELLIHRFAQDEFRLVIFSSDHNKQIVWKGWKDRPAIFNLCLFLEANHFSFVCDPKHILKVNYRA